MHTLLIEQGLMGVYWTIHEFDFIEQTCSWLGKILKNNNIIQLISVGAISTEKLAWWWTKFMYDFSLYFL